MLKRGYRHDDHSEAELASFKKQIKKACVNQGNVEENVVEYMNIVDTLTALPTLHERAIRTILKLICVKDDQVALNAINLLDYIVKNNSKIQGCMAHIANDAFLRRMVKTLPKEVRNRHMHATLTMSSEANAVKVERYDRVLVMIEQWSLVLGDNYPSFRYCYEHLVDLGVLFPAPNDRDLYSADMVPNNANRRPVMSEACVAAAHQVHLFRELLTNSDPDTDSLNDELVQSVLGQVMNTTKAMRTLSEGKGSSAEDAANILEQLEHSLLYYQGLVDGTALRTHIVADQIGGALVEEEPEPVPEPAPEPVMDEFRVLSSEELHSLSEEDQILYVMALSEFEEEQKQAKQAAESKEKLISNRAFEKQVDMLTDFVEELEIAPKPEVKKAPKAEESDEFLQLSIKRAKKAERIKAKFAKKHKAEEEKEAKEDWFAPSFGKTYSIEDIQNDNVDGSLDHGNRELYLSDEDFMATFKMDKAAWKKFPAWKKKLLKKEHNLF